HEPPRRGAAHVLRHDEHIGDINALRVEGGEHRARDLRLSGGDHGDLDELLAGVATDARRHLVDHRGVERPARRPCRLGHEADRGRDRAQAHYGVATMHTPHACGAPPMLWLSATVAFFTWRRSALPWSCL